MREELHRFFRAARGAGVRVSPAESIDAMKAVADVGFADRGILRDTLLLTLAKSQDEKQALGECFDLFFSQPEVQDEKTPEGAAEDAERDATAILGSSMGGLVSLYASFRYPLVFGRAGAMSPSVWFGQGAVLEFIGGARTPHGRIYLDVGMQEGAGALRDVRRLGRLLVRKGFSRDRRSRQPRPAHRGPDKSARHEGKPRLRYVEQAGGRHSEADWARRLASALEFLLQ
jgi:hypothetical protein